MKINKNYKLCSSLTLILLLSFQPTISYAQEAKSQNFFSKLFSKKTVEANHSTQNQIFKSDIDSLNIDTLIDFEFSIRDILKNYMDEENIKELINNITEKDNKQLDASTLEEFNKLLPKSSSEKFNGKAIIRVAKKLGKDKKTKFEIKKNILIKIISSFGIKITYSNDVKKKDVVKIEKEDEIDIKEASSSNMPVIAGIAGLGALGGGGGSSGGGTSSTFLDESTSFNENASLTATWVARQEYKNVSQYLSNSTINPYTLVGIDHAYGRGLSGTGKTIAVVDDGFRTNQIELSGKTITSYNAASVNQHGTHVSSIAAGSYNNNSSTFVKDNSSDDWTVRSGGSYPLLNYGTMGVAYNANLHLTDFDVDVTTLGLATTSAKNAGAIVQNNSWGWGTCQSGNCPQTIDVWVTYQNNNGTTDAQTLAALTDSEAGWTSYLSALDNFQSSGVIVVSAGNDSSSSEVNVQAGLPQIATELKESWLVVGNIDTSGASIASGSVTRQGNQCGVVAEYCIQADGTNITAADDDSNGDYQSLSGTSMAAPIVSGSVALLSEAFPNHTPAQLVDRILASANNTYFTTTGSTSFANGIVHGYNSEFGHGILDLEKALKPITSSMVSNAILLNNSNSSNVSNAQRFSLQNTQVRLGSAFGDAFQNSLNGRKAYFYDALNGGFAFDIGSLIKNQTAYTNQNHSFTSFLGDEKIIHKNLDNGMSFMSDKSIEDDIQGSIMTFLPISSSTSSFIGKNIHLQNALSFTQRSEDHINGINSNSGFNIPFIQASEKGTSIGNNTDWSNGTLSFGVFEGKSANYGLKTGGFITEYGQGIGNIHTSFFLGGTNEEGGFLETSINGAFAEQSTANTTFTGISSYGWLSDYWSYNALGTIASTHLNIKGAGLLNDINNVTSTSFAFEISRPVGLNNRDSFQIGISQPLRVETGDASVLIPQLYDTHGNLQFTQENIDLSPSGRQIDLNFGYQAKIDENVNLGLQLSISKDYGHIKSAELINSTFAIIKMDF